MKFWRKRWSNGSNPQNYSNPPISKFVILDFHAILGRTWSIPANALATSNSRKRLVFLSFPEIELKYLWRTKVCQTLSWSGQSDSSDFVRKSDLSESAPLRWIHDLKNPNSAPIRCFRTIRNPGSTPVRWSYSAPILHLVKIKNSELRSDPIKFLKHKNPDSTPLRSISKISNPEFTPLGLF